MIRLKRPDSSNLNLRLSITVNLAEVQKELQKQIKARGKARDRSLEAIEKGKKDALNYLKFQAQQLAGVAESVYGDYGVRVPVRVQQRGWSFAFEPLASTDYQNRMVRIAEAGSRDIDPYNFILGAKKKRQVTVRKITGGQKTRLPTGDWYLIIPRTQAVLSRGEDGTYTLRDPSKKQQFSLQDAEGMRIFARRFDAAIPKTNSLDGNTPGYRSEKKSALGAMQYQLASMGRDVLVKPDGVRPGSIFKPGEENSFSLVQTTRKPTGGLQDDATGPGDLYRKLNIPEGFNLSMFDLDIEADLDSFAFDSDTQTFESTKRMLGKQKGRVVTFQTLSTKNPNLKVMKGRKPAEFTIDNKKYVGVLKGVGEALKQSVQKEISRARNQAGGRMSHYHKSYLETLKASL